MTQYNQLTSNSGLYPQPGQLLVLPKITGSITLNWPYQNVSKDIYPMSSVILSVDTTNAGTLTIKLPLAANGSVPGIFNCYNTGSTTLNFIDDDSNIVLSLAPQNVQVSTASNNGQLILVSNGNSSANYWYGFNLNGVPVNNSIPRFLAGPGLRPYEVTQLNTYPMFNGPGDTPNTIIAPKNVSNSKAPLNVAYTSYFTSQTPTLSATFQDDSDQITITYITTTSTSPENTFTLTKSSPSQAIPTCTGIYSIEYSTPLNNQQNVNLSGTVENSQAQTSLAVSPSVNAITSSLLSVQYANRDSVFILEPTNENTPQCTLPDFSDAPVQSAEFLNGFTVSFINAHSGNALTIKAQPNQAIQAKGNIITLNPASNSSSVTLVYYVSPNLNYNNGTWYVLSSNGMTGV